MTQMHLDPAAPNLQALQQFSAKLSDGDVLRVKHEKDGSITLYTRGKGQALKDKLNPEGAARAHQQALQVLAQAMGKLASQPLSSVPRDQSTRLHQGRMDQLQDSGKRIGQQLHSASTLQGKLLKQVVGDMAVSRQALTREYQLDRMDRDVVRLMQALDKGDSQTTQQLQKTFAQLYIPRLATMPLQDQIKLAADPEGFKNGLLRMLQHELGPHAGPLSGPLDQAPPAVRQFLDGVYGLVMAQAPARMATPAMVPVPGTTHEHNTTPLHLQIQGKHYQFESLVAEGGFGMINRYRAADGSSVVLKVPHDKGPDEVPLQKEEASRELVSHAKAQGGGHPNVVGLKGVVLLPNGLPAPVMEDAPKGHGGTLMNKLLQEKGQMDPGQYEAVQLTLLQDMLLGLQHAQKGTPGGFLHLDIKPSNYVVGADGRVKLADFGASAPGGAQVLPDIASREQPNNASPELLQLSVEYLKHMPDREALQSKDPSDSHQQRLQAMDKLSPDQAWKLMKSIADPFPATPAMDAWALGVMAYQLFMGQLPFPQQAWSSQQAQNVIDFGNQTQLILPQPVPGLDESVRSLINGLLHPDPAQRVSVEDALRNPAFQNPNVGSTFARVNIKNLVG